MGSGRSPYDVLGVDPLASQAEVDEAWQRRVRDRGTNVVTIEVAQAHRTLSDPVLRKQLDDELHERALDDLVRSRNRDPPTSGGAA